jgi:trk system potassium uptake protein TrkH
MKKKSSPPNSVIPFNVHGNPISEEKIENTAIFAFVYFFILFIGTVIFMIFGFDFLDSAFQVVSALGTVGLQTMDLIGLNILLKLVLILAMIFGRLEIFPLLIVLKKIFSNKQ